MPLPNYLVKKIPKLRNIRKIRRIIDDCHINSVCESAKCPNIGECFSQNTLTFMILGDICTRHCRFCGVAKGSPLSVDPEEPQRIARAVKKLGLKYVVVTSVTRDDLADGGASQFAEVLLQLQTSNSALRTEVLIPDFQGNKAALQTVLAAKPFVLNHNIETIPRLYLTIRPEAGFRRSLELLSWVKRQKSSIYTKSGFMVGLGEKKEEIFDVLIELRSAGCDVVTIGQYLAPTRAHFQVQRFVEPDEFCEYESFGKKMGLKVFAGPFVRSSYRAGEIVK
ncbi:lipoyl synthase [candidate division WOR-1 bacterium RIFCSPLOWO2_02_FULL_46_20]|uniref:Lipoyl synthase n=2 Tax=Saganbacteria TaxID=1703751 RepID=A0A1F4RBA7_UNCSA|nr:MAG: lipoyl synthase [candidate division WOR-1 bacterium RIFCSPHIGHO2_02_FULL_45_12]OGC05464.1 MAG: lipoyl synthase [candidate division WOR-1 bacterium RIFCSPLOWO2_02_FULL_46_20]OGC09088.1 MAG: lipoyl synthase [candidate division WOR-1 bacterium RIFCSPLOWO2_12_FULL_45_9]